MPHNLVHALAPFGILLIGWQKRGADTFVAWLPVLAAVVGAINAAGRNRDKQSFGIDRVGKNRVQAKAAATWLPLRAMRMIEQSLLEQPGFARIRRFEQRRRLDAAVKRVRLVRMTLSDLPDLF